MFHYLRILHMYIIICVTPSGQVYLASKDCRAAAAVLPFLKTSTITTTMNALNKSLLIKNKKELCPFYVIN